MSKLRLFGETGYLPMSMNLQPWRFQRRKQALFRFTGVLLCGILLATLAVWWQYKQFAPQLQALKDTQSNLQEQLRKDENRQNALNESSIPFTSLANWHRLYLTLTSLQHHLPPDARIQRLELAKNLLIEGNSQSRQSVTQLIDSLTTQPGIARVHLREISEQDSIWTFSLRVAFDHYQLAQMFVPECDYKDCLER